MGSGRCYFYAFNVEVIYSLRLGADTPEPARHARDVSSGL